MLLVCVLVCDSWQKQSEAQGRLVDISKEKDLVQNQLLKRVLFNLLRHALICMVYVDMIRMALNCLKILKICL